MEKITWGTEKRKINDLIPHDANPRQMTEKQVKDLKASLEKFNLAEIPAINTDNVILAGHQRLKIMQLLGRGDEIIDVRVPSRTLTESEAKEYCIRSNKNVGEWDWDILANQFEETDLTKWGFSEWEFREKPRKRSLRLYVYGEEEVLHEVFRELTDKGFKCELKK